MNNKYNYKIYPIKIEKPVFEKKEPPSAFPISFIILILLASAAFAFEINKDGDGTTFGACLITLALGLLANHAITLNEYKDKRESENNKIKDAEYRQNKANERAEMYSQKLNSLLSKSDEIANQILPHYESQFRKFITTALTDFNENAFSLFWNNIDNAVQPLNYFKEALEQLYSNNKIYLSTLKNLNHNFPIPFPIVARNSISKALDEYKLIIRKAHTNPFCAIIWEQRRNTKVLSEGFKSLENSINNINQDICDALANLNNSIESGFSSMKKVTVEHLGIIEESIFTVEDTLYQMDTKLYYIEWNKRPPEKFHPRS